MRRMLALLLGVFAISLVSATAAFAVSPHFLKADASVDNAGNLVCSFKEAGLGSVPSVQITCSADATVVYACINGGGNHPKASNKETVNGPVQASGTFSVGHNGTVTGSLTLTAPGPGGFTCPSGQNLVLVSATFSGISLTDSTSGATATPTPNSCQ